MVNTPIPSSLKSEAKKAAKIIREFTIPSAKVGPEKIIPAGLVENAAGLAILTVAKVGFLVTARGGSGIVIARLNNGSWSAPSALGIAGLGGGFEIGAEVTDFIIILNKQSAVEAFSKGGNLTLGGNLTIAAGPVGRNLEGDVSLRSPAAIYTYSRTKGLFAGISIEGSGLIERKDANKKFYGEPIRAYEILSGKIDPPPDCNELYEVLDKHKEMFRKAAAAQAKSYAKREVEKQATDKGYGGFVTRVKSLKTTKTSKTTVTRSSSQTSLGNTEKTTTTSKYESTEFCDSSDEDENAYKPAYLSKDYSKKTSYSNDVPMRRSQSVKSLPGRPLSVAPQKTTPPISSRRSGSSYNVSHVPASPPKAAKEETEWDKKVKVRAIWAFQGQMPCDISFFPGDEIEVLTRTSNQQDWWEGQLNGRVGIFPANFTKCI